MLKPSFSRFLKNTMKHKSYSAYTTAAGPSRLLSFCEIPNCQQQSAKLSFPSSHVQMYYGLTDSDILKVCPSCVSKADDFQQKAIETIRKGGSLYELKHEPQTVPKLETLSYINMACDDGEDEEMDWDLDEATIAAAVDSILPKFQLQTQVQQYVQQTAEDAAQLGDEFRELDVECERVLKIANDVTNKCNNHFNKKLKTVVVDEADIPEDETISDGYSEEMETTMQVDTYQEVVQELDGMVILRSNSSSKRKRKPMPSLKPLHYDNTAGTCFPKVGDIVYAMNTKLENFWLKARVVKRIENAVTNEVKFSVEFEPTNKTTGKPVKPRGVMKAGALRCMRQLTTKQMAFSVLQPSRHPVGTRVVAEWRNDPNINPGENGEFYAGVIAEISKPSTKNRYLIFFDNGRAQYVSPERVLLVFSSSNEVWKDVHPVTADFIRNYLSNFPYCPLLRLPVGGLVSSEWNGKFGVVRVLEVDCSMAKFQSEIDELRIEWIYRGSSRIRSIYKSKDRHDASKTFDPDELVEYQGYIKKVEVPHSVRKPKKYKTHKCNPICAPPYFSSSSELKKINPLAIPLFLGWTRNTKRAVFYKAPCGMKLTNYSDLNDYLETTESNMPIDFFCFDKGIDVLDEFVPLRVLLYIENFAQEKEPRPVTLINSIDQDPLPSFEYITDSVGSLDVEVKMMLAYRKFSMSCTCTDNCKGKLGCACWSQTTGGKASGSLTPAKAYGNRRLQQNIIGGIYECNNSCSCKLTCPNRVVQCGITRPLQVFKTAKKGWALRALHDIPKGAFVCTYTGEVLTDAEADEVAQTHGSFYMAALNYTQNNDDEKKSNVKKIKKSEAIPVPIPRKEDGHVVDGRVKGNVGRFINHSCDPNLFIQNVFVDTHDSRFPQLAFFTTCLVKAGSELAFDYGYKKDTYPGTVMYCACESPYCRERML